MTGVWMTSCKNGQCELSVRRDGINKIVIESQTPLTDAQAEDLFWCIGAMQRSGKTLKDLLKEQESVVHCGDCENFCFDNISPNAGRCMLTKMSHSKTWFCAHGKSEEGGEVGMSERPKRKVEFIESYWTGGEYGSDYKWNDNHGELVRCRDCKYLLEHRTGEPECKIKAGWFPVKPNWFCADGERKDNSGL